MTEQNGSIRNPDQPGKRLQLDRGTVPWVCSSCKLMLGIVEGDVIRIKMRDVFVIIEATPGTKCSIRCRGCGKDNSITNGHEPGTEVEKQGAV